MMEGPRDGLRPARRTPPTGSADRRRIAEPRRTLIMSQCTAEIKNSSSRLVLWEERTRRHECVYPPASHYRRKGNWEIRVQRHQLGDSCVSRVCVCVRTWRALTYEAGWGGIGLDVLLSVALNQVPQPPHVARVEDVEGLGRVGFAALHVGAEQVVVRIGVPLRGRGGREI